MNYSWNWGILFSQTALADGTYADWFLRGTFWTLTTSALAWVIALAVGTAIGVLNTSNSRFVRIFAEAYIEVFRNIPLIVQMFLWFFVFPEVLPREVGNFLKREMPLPEFTTAFLALSLYTGARIAVQITAGIRSIPRGQSMAAYALGLGTFDVYRYVLLPRAARIVIPTLTSEAMNIVKNSAVALTIGLIELTATARNMTEYTFQGFEAFTIATLIYITIAITINRLMAWIERTTSMPGTAVS